MKQTPMRQPITTFTDGGMPVYWHFDGGLHCIVYGSQIASTIDGVSAGHSYGECVRHSLECAGKIDQ